MKASQFKQLIKEVVKEAVREELISLFEVKKQPVQKQKVQENLSFTTKDVINREALRKAIVGDDFPLPAPVVDLTHFKATNPVAQKFVEVETAKNPTNTFLGILAQTANEMNPTDLSHHSNLG